MGDDAGMAVRRLDDVPAARLRSAPYTYDAVGHTALGPPPGFHWFERSATLARRDLDGVSADLFGWRMQERSGLRVWASEVPLRTDTLALLRLGPGPLSIAIPCRVVYVVDEPDRRGFAYGTLPGHPESGEERFMLRRHDDGRIEATVCAFSRPATTLAQATGPLGRRFQHLMARRYLAALDRG